MGIKRWANAVDPNDVDPNDVDPNAVDPSAKREGKIGMGMGTLFPFLKSVAPRPRAVRGPIS